MLLPLMTKSKMQWCSADMKDGRRLVSTDVILFNIDSKPIQKFHNLIKDGIVKVFMKVFNEMQGSLLLPCLGLLT